MLENKVFVGAPCLHSFDDIWSKPGDSFMNTSNFKAPCFFLFQPMILKTRMCYTLFVKGQRRTKNICSRLSMATWRIPSPCRWCRLLSKKQLLSRQSQGEPAMKKKVKPRVFKTSAWVQGAFDCSGIVLGNPLIVVLSCFSISALPQEYTLVCSKTYRSDQRRVDKPGRG